MLHGGTPKKRWIDVAKEDCKQHRGFNIYQAPASTALKITNRSIRCASPHLCMESTSCLIPSALHKHPADDVTHSNSSTTCSPLSPSITHSLFHSRLKTHFFPQMFFTIVCWHPIGRLLGLYWTGRTLLNGFHFNLFFLFFSSCGRLSWLNRQLSSAR